MATIEEINLHNHKVIDTSNVLMFLLDKREMCDNETCIHLLYRFLDQLDEHLKLVDGLYQGMLGDKNSTANQMAEKFMSGEVELKRIINDYRTNWCRKGRKEIKVHNHESFMHDTEELFGLVHSRIQDEVEHLYPLVRDLRQSAA